MHVAKVTLCYSNKQQYTELILRKGFFYHCFEWLQIVEAFSLYHNWLAQESRLDLHQRRSNLRWAVCHLAAKDHIPTDEKSSLHRLKRTEQSVCSQGHATTCRASRDGESCFCFCRVWQRDSFAVVVLDGFWQPFPCGGTVTSVKRQADGWWLTTVLTSSWQSRLGTYGSSHAYVRVNCVEMYSDFWECQLLMSNFTNCDRLRFHLVRTKLSLIMQFNLCSSPPPKQFVRALSLSPITQYCYFLTFFLVAYVCQERSSLHIAHLKLIYIKQISIVNIAMIYCTFYLLLFRERCFDSVSLF